MTSTPFDTHTGSEPKTEQSGEFDVNTFDINSWLNGDKKMTAPTRSVTVYMDSGLVGEIESLEEELADLGKADDDEPASDDRPMAPSRRRVVAEEIMRKRRALIASAMRVRVRCPYDRDELREALSGAGPEPGKNATTEQTLTYQDESNLYYLAAFTVEPAGLTVEQWRQIRRGIGKAYFDRTILTTAAQAAAGEGVDVPFSLAASALTATP